MAELELVLQNEPERRRVMTGIVVLVVIFTVLCWLLFTYIPNPWIMAMQPVMWIVWIGKSIHRLYKLGKIFIRIGADGIAWKMSNDLALFMEMMSSPVTEGDYSWDEMSSVEYRADGIHLLFDDDDEDFISLYNFDYADRQKIKSALKEFSSNLTVAVDAGD